MALLQYITGVLSRLQQLCASYMVWFHSESDAVGECALSADLWPALDPAYMFLQTALPS